MLVLWYANSALLFTHMLPLKLSEVNLTWPKLIQQIQSDLFSVESKDLLGWCLIASVYVRAIKEGKHKLSMCNCLL